MRERIGLRRVLGLLVVALVAISARAQKPMAVSSAALNQHVVRRAPVEYPAEAKAEHEGGTVVLLVQVNAAGRVIHVEPLDGPAVLQATAGKSVGQWVFRPFRKDGAPVAVTGLVRVTFHAGGPATSVEKFLNKVRVKYATEPGLAEKGFECRVEPKWKEFPQLQNVPADSPLLERLRRTRVRLVVAKGGAPLTEVDKQREPKLSAADLANADQLVAATRRMVQGFYMTWLPFGILGPSAPANATMKTMSGKAGSQTVIQFERGGVTNWMSFDADARMLHFTELMPGGSAVEESPQFEATPEGLLYTGTDFEIHRGQGNTHGAYRIEYQKVDGVRMPKTVEVEVQGSLNVHFRFTGCKLGAE